MMSDFKDEKADGLFNSRYRHLVRGVETSLPNYSTADAMNFIEKVVQEAIEKAALAAIVDIDAAKREIVDEWKNNGYIWAIKKAHAIFKFDLTKARDFVRGLMDEFGITATTNGTSTIYRFMDDGYEDRTS